MTRSFIARPAALCGLLFAFGCASSEPAAGPQRSAPGAGAASATFEVRHELTIEVPAGAGRLRAWFTTPHPDDDAQAVRDWNVDAPLASRLVRDERGNQLLYLEGDAPPAGPLKVVTTFTLERQEVRADTDPAATRPLTAAERERLKRYLAPSEHVVIDERIRGLAAELLAGEDNPLRASRVLYDWVLGHVDYWVRSPDELKASGLGSSVYALEECTGNCTDFHALYAALSRAAGIPTRFRYGSFFKAPLDGLDRDQSYHCWLDVWAPGVGWVPLDVAVADLYLPDVKEDERNRDLISLTLADGYAGPDPARVDYYFGNLEPRRVTWVEGRDVLLEPRSAAGRLSTFVKAHVEVDGASLAEGAGWTRKLTFKERVD